MEAAATAGAGVAGGGRALAPCKVLMVGASGVGKSSLCRLMAESDPSGSTLPPNMVRFWRVYATVHAEMAPAPARARQTVSPPHARSARAKAGAGGVEMRRLLGTGDATTGKEAEEDDGDGDGARLPTTLRVPLDVWDLQAVNSITSLYSRGAHAVVLVVSARRLKASSETLWQSRDSVRALGQSSSAAWVIAVTGSDVVDPVSLGREAFALAEQWKAYLKLGQGIPHVVCSCVTGHGVEHLFNVVARHSRPVAEWVEAERVKAYVLSQRRPSGRVASGVRAAGARRAARRACGCVPESPCCALM